MAYITPDGQVCIMRGISLDSDYNHTVLQTSRDGQTRMLTGPEFRKFTFNEQSYQRVGSNKIRVATLADNLYDCNYMAFRNSGFGDKWFYAFITKVEYINNNTSEITYQIDEMQTWYFDYEIPECFVEREHTETDVAGGNIVPEGLPQFQLIPQSKTTKLWTPSSGNKKYEMLIFYVPNDKYVKITNQDEDGRLTITTESVLTGTQAGTFVNNVYMAACMLHFWVNPETVTARAQTSQLIRYITQQSGTIVKIIQIPKTLFDITMGSDGTGSGTINQSQQYYRGQDFKSANGMKNYIPKNKKLFTHPYRSIIISNNCGQESEYRWEWFTMSTRATFNFTCVVAPTPQIMCYPTNYRNVASDYDNGLIYNDFIEPSWSVDTFSQWWAQNKTAFIMSLISGTICTLVSQRNAETVGSLSVNATKGLAGKMLRKAQSDSSEQLLGMSGAKSMLNSVAEFMSMKQAPDQISSAAMGEALKSVQKREGFTIYDMGLEYDTARAVDNYFSMFGYAIKAVKRVNVKNPSARLRPHWNYIQTQNCIVHPAQNSGLDAADESAISKIYDKGITFWSNINEIGDYSLDNSPQ